MESWNEFFLKNFDFDVWDSIKNDHFIHTHFINNQVVNKPRNI